LYQPIRVDRSLENGKRSLEVFLSSVTASRRIFASEIDFGELRENFAYLILQSFRLRRTVGISRYREPCGWTNSAGVPGY
jgi:hypothetical protein